MIGDYTVAALVAPAAAVALEALLRTGLLRTARYWLTVAVTLAFQIPVDGWLTKLGHPIVQYAPGSITGIRWPWDIPIEDFGFGFALVTVTLLLWARATRATRPDTSSGVGDRREREGAER